MKTVFARYGDTFDTKESGADYDIDDVVELVGIIDRLNGGAGGNVPTGTPRARGAAPPAGANDTATGRTHG
jgi:hypothetical protein